MTSILGKIGDALGLSVDADDAKPAGREAEAMNATTGLPSTSDNVGGKPSDPAAGTVAASAASGLGVAGTDPIRSPSSTGGSLATGGQATAGTDPIRPQASGTRQDLGGAEGLGDFGDSSGGAGADAGSASRHEPELDNSPAHGLGGPGAGPRDMGSGADVPNGPGAAPVR